MINVHGIQKATKRYAEAVERSGGSCSTMAPSNTTFTFLSKVAYKLVISSIIIFKNSEDGNRNTSEHSYSGSVSSG